MHMFDLLQRKHEPVCSVRFRQRGAPGAAQAPRFCLGGRPQLRSAEPPGLLATTCVDETTSPGEVEVRRHARARSSPLGPSALAAAAPPRVPRAPRASLAQVHLLAEKLGSAQPGEQEKLDAFLDSL